MLDESMKWKGLPSMPKPVSHIECSWVIVNNSIVIVGGTTEKHPVTKRMILVGEVFQFNLNTLVFYLFLIIKVGNIFVLKLHNILFYEVSVSLNVSYFSVLLPSIRVTT